METREIKIGNMDYLEGEINIFQNSGYEKCTKADNPCIKIIFKETEYNKQQKTIYFKTA